MAAVPPSIAFLLDEFRGQSLSSDQVARRFDDHGFRDDLADQCLASLSTHPYADRTSTSAHDFLLYATGGLSPLSDEAKCESVICRMAYTAHFARTSCLYADKVILTDEVSHNAPGYDSRRAFTQVLVLRRLRSLIEAGVIEFGTPEISRCSACSKVARATTTRLARELWKEFMQDVNVFLFKHGGSWRLSFGSPLFFADGQETRMTLLAPPALRRGLVAGRTVSGADARRLARALQQGLRPFLRSYASTLVFEANIAALSGAAIATNSCLGATALRRLDQRALDPGWLGYGLKIRSIPLLTLQSLWPYQVLELREQAKHALPAFRARLRTALLSSRYISTEADEARRARAVAEELASEARAVEAELAGIHVRSVKRRERLLTTLGTLLQLVAFGTKRPDLMMGATGVLGAALFAAHQTASERERHHQRLIRQPAYVVLAAEQVHAERH